MSKARTAGEKVATWYTMPKEERDPIVLDLALRAFTARSMGTVAGLRRALVLEAALDLLIEPPQLERPKRGRRGGASS